MKTDKDKDDEKKVAIDELKRKHHVRQDRVFVAAEEVLLKTSKNSYKVVDCSAFGLAVRHSEDILSEFVEGDLVIGDVELGQVYVKKVRSEKLPFKDDYKIAFAVVGEPLHLEALRAVLDVRGALKNSEEQFYKYAGLSDGYKWSVINLKNWLLDLETGIQSIAKRSFESRTGELIEFEETVAALVARYIDSNIQPFYDKIGVELKDINSKLQPLALEYFRDSLGPLFYQSYYAFRAYKKPRGYAGDFEMMNTVYQKENRGDTLFAKCLHRYFVEVPEAQAVRNRAAYLEEKLIKVLSKKKSEKVKIFSVACGPSMELKALLWKNPELFNDNVEIHLLDQDEEALKETQRNLEIASRQANAKPKFFYHNMAIKNLVEQGFSVKDFDLIYSAGLFDYFSDPVAFYAAKQFMSCAKKGAQVIIGNFSANVPNKFGMVAIMDWHLVYRSPEDLKRIFEPLGKLKIEKEPLGINLFVTIENE